MAKNRKTKAHSMANGERTAQQKIEDLKIEANMFRDSIFQLKKSKETLEESNITAQKNLKNLKTETSLFRDAYFQLKKSKTELEESEKKFRTVFEHITDVVFSINLSRQVTFVTPNVSIFGYTPQDAVGHNFMEFVHPDDVDLMIKKFNTTIKKGSQPPTEFRLRCKDGSYVFMEESSDRIMEKGKPVHLAGSLRGISERKKAEENLKRLEKRYHGIFQASQDALMLLDEKGFFDCNQATLKMFGYKTVSDFCTKHPGQVSPPIQPDGTSSMKLSNKWIKDAFKKGSIYFEWIHRRKNGQDFPATVQLVPYEIEGKKALQATVRDITERKFKEEQLFRINRALRVISECNQVLVREKDQQKLLDQICKLLVEDGGYRMAWVGFAEQDTKKTVRLIASFGYKKGYLETTNITWANTQLGRGPAGMAIRTGKVQICRDILTDSKSAPLRSNAIKLGYVSSIALPLIADKQTFGALNIYSEQPNAFDAAELELLNELVGDVAYGIKTIRSREQLIKAEEDIEVLSRFPKENPSPVLRVSKKGLLVYANPAGNSILKEWNIKEGEILPQPYNKIVQDVYRSSSSSSSSSVEMVIKDKFYYVVLRAIKGKGYINLYFFDATSRKKAEESLRQAETKFRSIFEGGSDGILIADVKTKRFTMANPAICRFLGYKERELLKMGLSDIHPKASLPWVMGQFMQQFKGILTIIQDIPCLRKDKTIVYADIAAASMNLDGVAYNIGFFRDATVRRRSEMNLQESKNFLDKVINTMSDPVFVKDDKCRFVLVNDAEVALTGLKRKDQIGKTTLEKYPKKQAAVFLKSDMNVLKTGKENVNEEQLTNARGKTFTIVTKKTRYIDAVGNKFLVGVIRDITERKKKEEELRVSEERFSQIAESAEEFIWEVDAKGIFTYASPVIEKILGYKPEEVVGKKHFYDLSHPNLKEQLKKAALQIFASEKSFKGFINSNVHKNGQIIFLETSGSPILDGKGNLLGYRGSNVDITQRKRSEEVLRESEEKYRSLTENATDQIFMLDKNHRYLSANQALVKLFRKPVDKIIGRPVTDFFPKNTAGKIINNLDFVFKTGRPKANFEEMIQIGGHVLYSNISLNPIKNSKGQVIAVVGIVRDITQQKKAENELREKEASNRRILDSLPLCIKMFDPEGNLISINQHGREEHSLEGWTDEQIRKWEYLKCITPEYRPQIKRMMQDAIAGKSSSITLEHTHDHAKGGFCHSEILPVTIDGKIQFILFVSQDVTENKKMEEALAELKLGMERSDQIVFTTDKEGNITYVNPAFEKVYGYKPKEVLGKTPRILKSGKQSLGFYKRFWDSLLQKKTINVEMINKAKDNKMLYIRQTANPILNEKGDIIGFLALQTDITEKKAIEDELRKKVEQMEFVGRVNLKRHKKELEMGQKIKQLEEQLKNLKN